MKKITVGVVGYGFVGKAVAAGFNSQHVVLIDPILGTSTKDLLDKNPDVVFICVPTPMGKDGSINASIVENVLMELKDLDTLLVLKSTVVPEIVAKLSDMYPNFIYNPEFLTEANAVNDFANPFLHVFGGNPSHCDKLQQIYENYSVCTPCEVQKVTAAEAALIKYGINSFLSMKVGFFNQYFDLCEKLGADYLQVKRGISMDPRIGASHTNVPGPDGRRGFGSACFSKDVPAIIHQSNLSLSILREVWNSNCDYRNAYEKRLQREIEQHIEFEKI